MEAGRQRDPRTAMMTSGQRVASAARARAWQAPPVGIRRCWRAVLEGAIALQGGRTRGVGSAAPRGGRADDGARCAQTLGRPLVKDAMRYETWETAQSRLSPWPPGGSPASRPPSRRPASTLPTVATRRSGRCWRSSLTTWGLAAEVAAVVAGPSPPRWRTRWSGLRELAKAEAAATARWREQIAALVTASRYADAVEQLNEPGPVRGPGRHLQRRDPDEVTR
jgi:hypothetical protein